MHNLKKGPSYKLPSAIGYVNHDFTLNRRPAYTIGNKYRDISKPIQKNAFILS